MEATIVDWGYIGMMERKMETAILLKLQGLGARGLGV